VEDAQGSSHLALLMAIELLKERDQGSGVFDRDVHRVGNFFKDSLIRFEAGGGADAGSADAARGGGDFLRGGFKGAFLAPATGLPAEERYLFSSSI